MAEVRCDSHVLGNISHGHRVAGRRKPAGPSPVNEVIIRRRVGSHCRTVGSLVDGLSRVARQSSP